MNVEVYINRLKESGWFEEYPETLKNIIEGRIREQKRDFWRGLVVGSTPAASINEEGDYKEALRHFSDLSCGVFSPTDIEETWRFGDDTVTEEIELSFDNHGNHYWIRFEVSQDVCSPFLELIDEVIRDSCTPLRFIQLEVGDREDGTQDGRFVLTTLEAYIKAYQADLLPKWNYDPFDNAEWNYNTESPLTLKWHLIKSEKTWTKK